MMNYSLSASFLPVSNPDKIPVDKNKLLKLENRFFSPESTTGGTRAAGNSSQGKKFVPSGDYPTQSDFPGFISFFSRVISLSNHYLFYHYLIQLTLTEIDHLVSQRKYNNAFSLRASMVASEGFIDQFTDIGIIHENEKNSIFLIKLMRLAQFLGYVYSLFPGPTDVTSTEDEGYSSPMSSTAYRFTNVLPLHEVLEKSLNEKTTFYTVLWILSFLNMFGLSNNNGENNITSKSIVEVKNRFIQFKEVLMLLNLIQNNDKYSPITEQFDALE